jgi:hypothetical protein
MQMLFSLSYALCMREVMKLTEFLLLMFLLGGGGSKFCLPLALLVFDPSLGNAKTFFCMLVQPSKLVHSTYATAENSVFSNFDAFR